MDEQEQDTLAKMKMLDEGRGDADAPCVSSPSSATATCSNSGDIDGLPGAGATDIKTEPLAPIEDLLSYSDGLIGEHVALFLTFGDLKAASMVSKTFDKAFRGSKAFSESAVLLIRSRTIELKNFLVDTTYPWRLVEVDLSVPKEVMEIIQDILMGVHTLRLKLSNTNMIQSDIVDFLISLFICSPNLKFLRLVRGHLNQFTVSGSAVLTMIVPRNDSQMESMFYESVLHDVFADTGVQAQLAQLQALEITNGNKSDSTCYICGEEGEDAPFPRNFLQLSLITMQLKSFKLAKISTVTGGEADHVKFIPQIIGANVETLEELSLHLNIWLLNDMKFIRCPKLKRLNLSAHVEGAENVAAFLQNHPPLEELSIHVRDCFPTSVFSVIQGKASKLRKLHIKAKMFGENGNKGSHVNWSFLSELPDLRDFSIVQPYSNTGSIQATGITFLKALPETLRRLHIRGLCDFWEDKEAFEELPMDQRINLLRKFKNLRSFRLVRCENCLDDELILTVFKEMTELQELEFTNCEDVDGETFRGICARVDNVEEENAKEEEEKADDEDRDHEDIPHVDPTKSIANLKALQKLSIRKCPDISLEEIQLSVASKTLQFFDFGSSDMQDDAFKEDTLLKFVCQNPSLEVVRVSLPEEYVGSKVGIKLKEANPRIWEFVNNGDKSHYAESDEFYDSDRDSDSDADSELHGDGDSDISGGGYYALAHDLDFDDFEDEDEDDYGDFGEDDDAEDDFYG